MNLERGFRRITFVLSVAGVAFGLGVTGYDVYKTVVHVWDSREWGKCNKEAEQWLPKAGDTTFPGEWTKPWVPFDRLSSSTRNEYARMYRLELCYDAFMGRASLPAHLRDTIRAWDSAFFVPLWAMSPGSESYAMIAFPLVWGIALTLVLGSLPWGLFNLTRWIALGFGVN